MVFIRNLKPRIFNPPMSKTTLMMTTVYCTGNFVAYSTMAAIPATPPVTISYGIKKKVKAKV